MKPKAQNGFEMHSTGSPFRQSACENQNMFKPLQKPIQGNAWMWQREGKEPMKPLWPCERDRNSFPSPCAKSPAHSTSESHRIPYVLSIDPHIDPTLLKMIIQLFSHFHRHSSWCFSTRACVS